MLFYVILFLICYSLAFISSKCYKKKRTYNNTLLISIDFLPYLLLIIITGFRYNVGNDYSGYNYLFNYNETPDFEKVEITFKIINNIAHFFGFNQQFLFLLYALITYTFLYLSIKYYDPEGKYRHYIMLLILFTVFFNSFNTIRQMAAVSIFFFSTKYIIERKFLFYLFWVIIAGLFHKSAFFTILFYVIPLINFNLLIVFLLISPFFILTDISNILLKIIINIFNISSYEVYLDNYNTRISINGGENLIFQTLIGLIMLYIAKKTNLEMKENFIIKLFAIFVMMNFIGISSLIVMRMVYYPKTSFLVIFPFISEIIVKKNVLVQEVFPNSKYFRIFENKITQKIFEFLIFTYIILLLIRLLMGYSHLFFDNNILDYKFRIFLK